MGYFKLKNVAGIMVAVSVANHKNEAAPAAKVVAPPAPPAPVVGTGPSAALQEFLDQCHKRNAHTVSALARKITDRDELMLAHDHEKLHPKFAPEGRVGVLNVIEECFGEQSVRSPALPQDL